jgi:hypothetical protein
VSDTITKRLAEIRANDYRRDRNGAAAYRQSDLAAVDVPALLAAVEAVLRHHEPVTTANGMSICPNCSRAAGTAVFAPCEEVRDISAALSGGGEAE